MPVPQAPKELFRYFPALIGLAGVVLLCSILFQEELATYRFEMANPDRGICGMPAFAVVLAGTLFAALLGMIGSLWLYVAHRHTKPRLWKWQVAAIALDPIWFWLVALGIFSGFNALFRN